MEGRASRLLRQMGDELAVESVVIGSSHTIFHNFLLGAQAVVVVVEFHGARGRVARDDRRRRDRALEARLFHADNLICATY